jgi:Zn-dependent metalloprotease
MLSLRNLAKPVAFALASIVFTAWVLGEALAVEGFWWKSPQTVIIGGRAESVPLPSAFATKLTLDAESEHPWEVFWHERTGLPRRLEGQLTVAHTDIPAEGAEWFIDHYRPLFTGCTPAEDVGSIAFEIIDTTRDHRGITQVTFETLYRGVPVHYSHLNPLGHIVVFVDSLGHVFNIEGSPVRILNLDLTPRLGPSETQDRILSYLVHDSVEVVGEPKLAVYPCPEQPRLVYTLDVAIIRDGPYYIARAVLDAVTGEMIEIANVEVIRRPTSAELAEEREKKRSRIRGWLKGKRKLPGAFGHVYVPPSTYACSAKDVLDLQSTEPWKVRWDAYTGLPKKLWKGERDVSGDSAEEIAQAFLSAYKPLFTGLPETDTARVDFRAQRIEGKGDWLTILNFETVFDGIPVYSHGCALTVDSTGAIRTVGTYGNALVHRGLGPRLSPDSIQVLLRDQIRPDSIDSFAALEPFILARDSMLLVYFVDASVNVDGELRPFRVIADAITGEILKVLEYYFDWPRSPRVTRKPPRQHEEEYEPDVKKDSMPATLRDWLGRKPRPPYIALPPNEAALKAKLALDSMSPEPWDIEWNDRTGLPVGIAGRSAKRYTGSLELAAIEFIEQNLPLLTGAERGAESISIDFELRAAKSHSRITRVSFAQTYEHIPIQPSSVGVDFDTAGYIVRMRGTWYPMDDPPANAPLPIEEAIQLLRERLQPDSLVSISPATLVIHPGPPARYAYDIKCRVRTYAMSGRGIIGPLWNPYQLLVDASTCEILHVQGFVEID